MTQSASANTSVLLSFSGAYAEMARHLGEELKAANINVRYDQWEGEGDVTARPDIDNTLEDTAFVLPLLTPSYASRTWIGEEWKTAIFDRAQARGIDVLPVRGAGESDTIPEFLRALSFADLHKRDRTTELHRLVAAIRKQTGDNSIVLPVVAHEPGKSQPSMMLPERTLVIKLGEKLYSFFKGSSGTSPFGQEMVPMMRDGLYYELGVAFPAPELRLLTNLPPFTARIEINNIPETQLDIPPNAVMVNESVTAMSKLGIAARPVTNPATGAPCAWIPAEQVAVAEKNGLIIWDAYGYMILALSAILRRKAAAFLGLEECRAMLEQIQDVFPHLIAETVPKTVSLFLLTDVLRRLVAEEVSIRNFRRILMTLADWGRRVPDPHLLCEYLRAALQRQISYKLSRGTNQLIVFLLHPDIENSIRDNIRYTATGSYLDLAPTELREILSAVQKPLAALGDDIQMPQILTVMEIRSCVRRLVAPLMPKLHVISYQELKPDANIQPVGTITLHGFQARAGVSAGGAPVWADDS